MNFVKITKDNIDSQHICCAIADKKSTEGYNLKKQWIKNNLEKGYVFNKLDVRGKVFIEYGPSEITYLPVDAPNTMVINCFWVSGKYKGQGYGKKLLDDMIKDCKNKSVDGIVVLVSDKKRPFMSDKKFFLKNGFELIDKASPYFELMYYKIKDSTKLPSFLETSREGICKDNGGFKVYYSNLCPYMNYYIDLQSKIAKDMGVKYEVELIDSKEKSLLNPSPFTIYSLFYKGKFITQELTSEKKFKNIIESFHG